MLTLLLVILAQQSNPHYPPSRERINRFRFELSNATGGSVVAPAFGFATASGVGMGTECAGTSLTTVQGGALTFTRASSGYCTKGNPASMLTTSMVLLTTDKPRAMAGDGSGQLGLLMENASTNDFIQSEAFDNAAWTVLGGVSVSADTTTTPWNTLTGDSVDFAATTVTRSVVYQIANFSGAGTVSVFAKGTVTTPSGTFDICATPLTCVACAYNASTWVRCSSTGTQINGGTTPFIGNDSSDNGGVARPDQTIALAGGSLEPLSFASSYIPTTTVAVTRSAEAATADYVADGGTISMSATVLEPAAFTTVGKSAMILYFDANNRLRINNSQVNSGATTTMNALFRVASTDNNVVGANVVTGGASTAVAAYYDGVNVAICVNGSCEKSPFTITLPTGAASVYPGNSQAGSTFEIDGVVKNVCVDITRCPSYGQ